MSTKFFVFIPQSWNGCGDTLDKSAEGIQVVGKVTFQADRGGNPNRDYSLVIYKVTNPDDPTEVRISLMFMKLFCFIIKC